MIGLFFLPIALFGCILGHGLLTGRIHAKGAVYNRTEQPIFYWITAGAYLAGMVAFVVLLARAASVR